MTSDGPAAWLSSSEPIRVGVSSCLLGEEVRFDGGHKRDRFLTDTLAGYVEWVPVCPEFEVGMGIPREPIRLVRQGGEIRLIAERSGTDHTDSMRAWAKRRVSQLERLGLCGYMLKKDSPSCGMERVRVHNRSGGPPKRDGRGMFAEELMGRLSGLPVEEEGRLNDPRLRENFVERLFARRRLLDLLTSRWRLADLVAFHTAHKLQLLAHSPADHRVLGRLVAEAKPLARTELAERYGGLFMSTLAKPATAKRNVNVLQHALGHLKKLLDAAARAELLETIEDYGRGLVPLVVPITLLRHHVREHDVAYLADQTYLRPHPKELMLRNHV